MVCNCACSLRWNGKGGGEGKLAIYILQLDLAGPRILLWGVIKDSGNVNISFLLDHHVVPMLLARGGRFKKKYVYTLQLNPMVSRPPS